MPLARISKRTEKLLIIKQRDTGMTKKDLLEFGILELHNIPLKKIKRVNDE